MAAPCTQVESKLPPVMVFIRHAACCGLQPHHVCRRCLWRGIVLIRRGVAAASGAMLLVSCGCLERFQCCHGMLAWRLRYRYAATHAVAAAIAAAAAHICVACNNQQQRHRQRPPHLLKDCCIVPIFSGIVF